MHTYHCVLICCLAHRHLGCFFFLFIMIKATGNLCVQVFLQKLFLFLRAYRICPSLLAMMTLLNSVLSKMEYLPGSQTLPQAVFSMRTTLQNRWDFLRTSSRASLWFSNPTGSASGGHQTAVHTKACEGRSIKHYSSQPMGKTLVTRRATDSGPFPRNILSR